MNGIKTPTPKQRGIILVEALVAMLVFSIGILALIGVQAASIKHVGDAKYRADASFLADQVIGRMWADRTNLPCYTHPQPAGVCASAPSKANLQNWLANVGMLLPGAATTLQQISVDADNQVTVTVAWRAAQDTQSHKFVASAHING